MMASSAQLRILKIQQQRSLVASASSRGGSVGHSRSTSTMIALSSPSISTRPLPTKTTRFSSVAARATPTKPMPAWDGIYAFITKRNLETISPREAFSLASKKGWIVVDVRPSKRHSQSAPELGDNIVSIPLYDTPDFSKPSLTRFLRAALLASQGVAPVEQNEEFVEKILDLMSTSGGQKKGLLMLCEVGGSLVPTANFATGKAAFRALEAGVDEKLVKHVGGGCFAWAQEEDLPMTAEYDASGAGRTPGIVGQEQRKK